MNLKAFSQKAIIYSPGKDTLICFSVPQARFLLKEQYRLQMTDSLLNVCELQNSECDTFRVKTNQLIEKYESAINLCIQYKDIQDAEINNLYITIENQKKVIKREKINKTLAIMGGGLLSGFFGYLLITK